MAEEPSLAPQWLKSGITAAGTSNLRTEEAGDGSNWPASPGPRIAGDTSGRDSYSARRSNDWGGKGSQVNGPPNQHPWDKPSLRAHHRGGAHRNIFEDHSSDIFGPSTGAGKHSHGHHHRAGPNTPNSPFRAPKDVLKEFPKESGKDYGGAWAAESHPGQAGPRGPGNRDRVLNARGPALNGLGGDSKSAGRGAGARHHQDVLDKDYLPPTRLGPGLRDIQQPLSPGALASGDSGYTRLADTPSSPARPFSPQPPSPASPAGPARLQNHSFLTGPAAGANSSGSSATTPTLSPRVQKAKSADAFGPATPAPAALRPAAVKSDPAPSSAGASSRPNPEPVAAQRLGGWATAAQEKAAAAAQNAAAARTAQGAKGWAGLAASAAGPGVAGAGQSLPSAGSAPTAAAVPASTGPQVTRMADAISQQQVTSAAAMQQVASEQRAAEKALARQAKLIPAIAGPRPRQGGPVGQPAKPPAMASMGPPPSSKAVLGPPRASSSAEGRSIAPVAISSRRSSAQEEVPASSGPTPLMLNSAIPDKLSAISQPSGLARASSDVGSQMRAALLSPTKSGAPPNGLAAAALSAAKPPGTPTGIQNKTKERNSFFQSLRRTKTQPVSERPSSSSSLSPASSLDAPSLANSGRAETGDTPGLSSLAEVVQEQLGSNHGTQNGYHPEAAIAAMNGQAAITEETALLQALDMTAEELDFMRRLGWTPEPASTADAEGLTEEEIRSFKEQQARSGKPAPKLLSSSSAAFGKSRSLPFAVPKPTPWRNAYGMHRLANLDIGSYGSKLSDSDSEAE